MCTCFVKSIPRKTCLLVTCSEVEGTLEAMWGVSLNLHIFSPLANYSDTTEISIMFFLDFINFSELTEFESLIHGGNM